MPGTGDEDESDIAPLCWTLQFAGKMDTCKHIMTTHHNNSASYEVLSNASLYFQSFYLCYLFSQFPFSSMRIQWWCSDIWTRKPMTDAPVSSLTLRSNQEHSRRDQTAVIPDDWLQMWSDLRVFLPCTLASIRDNVRNSKSHVFCVPQSSTFSQKNLCLAALLWSEPRGENKSLLVKWKYINNDDTKDGH